MRIAFFGTPQLCIPILEALSSAGYTPVLIVTAPDRSVGRKQILTEPPVKTWGTEHSIPVVQPEKLRGFEEVFEDHNIDISLVVAYGKIIPRSVITTPKYDTLNIHYSLLPRWRGASPVEAALLAGDEKTGVCVQRMVYELDAGDVLATEEVVINDSETTPELRNRLNTIGAQLLVDTLPKYINDEITSQPQNTDEVTTCGLIKKSDGEIQLTDSDEEKWRKYRAYYGWPGIFYFDENGKRVKITQARFDNKVNGEARKGALGYGKFIIEKIIPEGKKEQPYSKQA